MLRGLQISLLLLSLGITGCFFKTKPPEDKIQVSNRNPDKPENGEGYSGGVGKGYSGNSLLKQVKQVSKTTTKKKKGDKKKTLKEWDSAYKFVDAESGKTTKSKLKKSELNWNAPTLRENSSISENENTPKDEIETEHENIEEQASVEKEEDNATDSAYAGSQIKGNEAAVAKVEELLKEASENAIPTPIAPYTSVFLKMNAEPDGQIDLISKRKVFLNGTLRPSGGPFDNSYFDYDNSPPSKGGMALPVDSIKFKDEDFTIETYFKLANPVETNMSTILTLQAPGRKCAFDISYYKGIFYATQKQTPSTLKIPVNISYFDWHHLAASRKNGIVKFFVDGMEIGQMNMPIYAAKCVNDTGEPMLLFAQMSGTLSYFRITKGYGRYYSSFIPPGLDQLVP